MKSQLLPSLVKYHDIGAYMLCKAPTVYAIARNERSTRPLNDPVRQALPNFHLFLCGPKHHSQASPVLKQVAQQPKMTTLDMPNSTLSRWEIRNIR